MNHSIDRRTATRVAIGVGFGAMTLDFSSQPGHALEDWPDFSFLIVTDTHVGYKNGDSARKQWKKTSTDLARAKGDFVLHLGDLVDKGQEDQYSIYKEIRDTIGKPFYEIPGNHDPQDLFEKHIHQTPDRSFDHGGVRFVLFNNSSTESHEGFITDSQNNWLQKEFEEAADKNLRILICAHVPIHDNRHPDRGWYVKPENGQAEFYQLVDKHRDRVLAIFHGHFHNGIRGWNDRSSVHEILFPSALYNLDRGLEEKGAPGYNLKEFRPGYVFATFVKGQLNLRYQVTGESDSTDKLLDWKN